ncbi:predicted protein [Plenodomus lingam JN3]|uniref:Predicted protein n=1 Tax=Leptosphaeria maculans (strain JN3 / isolate v23.1.3 / race Av1-4-5-6-7-8) TaxID=985895 RepID=E4ZYV1_LEPMJ|nr:predicted protein [Plenodomus lingam JN3]CBX96627.1 predicted protein [Plenodomus lingam JN3]
MTSTIGIPIKLLNEAAGHIVTLEITSGEVYRGKLIEGTRGQYECATQGHHSYCA